MNASRICLLVSLLAVFAATACDREPQSTSVEDGEPAKTDFSSVQSTRDVFRVPQGLPDFHLSDGPAVGDVEITATPSTIGLAETLAGAARAETTARLTVRSVQAAETQPWWLKRDAVAVLGAPMTRDEIHAFEKHWGYRPQRISIARDPVIIIVHRLNPIAQARITLDQLNAAYALHPRTPASAKTWGDLGLSGEWAQTPISPYGHDASSPLYAYFQQHVLHGGDFKPTVSRDENSAAVVARVSRETSAIGYATLNALDKTVGIVPIATDGAGSAHVPTDLQTLKNYPLLRSIYLYMNKPPGTPLPAPQEQLVQFVYSRQGQSVVAESGYAPLTPESARKQAARLSVALGK